MKNEYFFYISGEPAKTYKNNHEKKVIWDTYSENRCRYNINLKNQYTEPILLGGSLDATFKFYIPNKARYNKEMTSIIDLFRFINSSLVGIVYKRETILNNVVLEKIYSEKPHTEIILKIIEGDE